MSNSTAHFGRYFEEKLRQAGHFVFDDDEDETWHIQPCSEQEIQEIEKANHVKLPQKYKEFLSVMGRNAGDLFRSELCAYPELMRLTADGSRLLEKWNTDFRLSPTHFVIWMHGGYMFCFFDTASGASDPPVFICRDSLREPLKVSESFTDWMEVQLRDNVKVRES